MMNTTLEHNMVAIAKCSIRPNKIVFYNQLIDRNAPEKNEKKISSSEKKAALAELGEVSSRAVDINAHNFELSKKAAGRIKEKVSWLYELARNKSITLNSGKVLSSFKMNFITLTLPALQRHKTSEITATCLNQFLTEFKQRYGLANYVWRLEFQKNGNAHYHIATDTFIDYKECKVIWNRCLRKLGYLQDYTNKMSGLTFAQYRDLYKNDTKVSFEALRKRYALGCSTFWDAPNTVDVRAVSNAKNISFYISKYITKKSEHTLNPVVAAREDATTNLRLWYCSSSLSKLDKIEVFIEEYDKLVWDCFANLQSIKKFTYDYVDVWYFNNFEQSNEGRAALWQLYRRYASERGYIPAK